MNNYNPELQHYGVLGMKWGKRKADGTRETTDEAVNRLKTSNKASSINAIKTHLSDSELRERINRIQMESTIRDMANKSSVSRGIGNKVKNVVLDTVKGAAESIVKDVGKQAARQGFNTIIDKYVQDDVWKDALNLRVKSKK